MLIQEMRNRSQGVAAKIIVGLIIVVFALFGFGSITTFLAPVPKVATVAGEDITRQEMETAVERNRRMMLSSGTPPEEIDEDQLRKDVLDQLINRQLLMQAANDLGLHVSEEAVDEQIIKTSAFQVDGVFDAEQFQLVLRSAGYTPVTYRRELRRDMKFQQLANGIQSSAFLTRKQALRASALADQTRDVAFLRIDAESLMDEVEVTPGEVEQYYQSHPEAFRTPETVNLAYLELKREDLMDQVEVTEEELRAHYEEMKDTWATGEKRQIAHILVETNDEVSKKEARAEIEKIQEQLKQGEDFAALAKEYSDDPGSAADGGDLGYNTPGTFVVPFEEVAFNLDVNKVSEPVETEFGYHLIKVLDVEPATTPSFAEVRDKVANDLREARAEEIFVEKSSKLGEIAYESADLETPANELGLEIKTTGPVTRNAKTGIAANKEVMDRAFSPDLLIDRNNSDIIEITPNHHVVVRVREHQQSEVKPLAEVREKARDVLAREKATDLAQQRAVEIVAMLEGGSIARYVADKFGLEWQVVPEARRNQMDLNGEINAKAFDLARPPEDGKSVGYTLLSDGDAAVVTVTNVENGSTDMTEQELLRVTRALGFQQGRNDFAEFRANLARQAEVTRQ